MTGVRRVPGAFRAFLRSLSIQGSWNERTMLGGGFAHALLPVLRRRHGGDPVSLREGVRRHLDHFNAHPYLAPLALGAVARQEADGEDPERILRFKRALRGPLGAIGDRLVWAGVLPLTLLVALLAAVFGADPLAVVLLFLVPYNAVHLALRIWAYRTGLRRGPDVAAALREADLGGRAEEVRRWLPLVLGALGGALGTRLLLDDPGRWPVLVLAIAGLAGGWFWGRPLLRPLTAGVVLLGLAMVLVGVLP